MTRQQAFYSVFHSSRSSRLFSRPKHKNIRGKTALKDLLPRNVPGGTCLHYDLEVDVDPKGKFISGTNVIRFEVLTPDSLMQLDLQEAYDPGRSENGRTGS